jgi:hypothetical protein
MLSGLVRHLQLTVVSKTGISTPMVIIAIVAAVSAAAMLLFLIFAIFIWLAERYSPLTGALIMSAGFLLLAIGAGVTCMILNRRTAAEAQRALAARSQQPWFDPRFLAVGLQVGKSIGLRRIVPLVAAGLLAASLAKEWFGERPPGESNDS